MQSTRSSDVHIAVKYSDNFSPPLDTIASHSEVIRRFGVVWFGKIGQPLSAKNIKIFNNQIEAGVRTYLYLLKGRSTGDIFCSRVVHMCRDLPDNEEHLIPDYYAEREISKHINLWIKVSEISSAPVSILSQLKVATTGISLKETLVQSMAGFFIVR